MRKKCIKNIGECERAGAACIVLLLVVVVVCQVDFKILLYVFSFMPIISRPSFRIGRERRKLQLTGVNASLHIKRIILLVPKQNEDRKTKQKKNDFGAAAVVAIRPPNAQYS